MSATYQLNRAIDAIHRAVQEAIEANMTVDDFRRSAAESWQIVLRDMQRDAGKDWAKP